MQVRSLRQEDPLEEGMATQSTILAGRIPWTEEPGELHSPWGHKELVTTEQLSTDNPLSTASFTNIFSHSVGCLFILFMVSFAVQILLGLVRSHLFIFVFIFITLGGN